jgi:tripartite-type tricarboxylate transporter receptor subunit TctC
VVGFVRLFGVALFSISVAYGVSARAEVSFKGKTINIIINSRAGGGTDASGRLLGSALGNYLPGKPQVVFRNMPGGGGLKANNYFAAKVKPDGLTLITGSRTQISPVKLLSGRAKYDPSKFEFIGGDVRLGTVFLVRADAKDRLLDPKAKPLVFGDIDGSRSGALISLWAKEYLGWNIRYVVGYSGTPALILAARSGELQMIANQNAFTVEPLIKSGELVPIAQMGVRDDTGTLQRRSTFPNVPLLTEALVPKLDEKGRKAFKKMEADRLVNKWMALPPGTPSEIVAVYRDAFSKATKDKDFLKVVYNEIGKDYTPLSGQQLKEIATTLVDVTKDDLAFINEMKKKNGLPLD